MRSHKFINSLLYLIIQLVAKESRANENNREIRCFFILFIDKRYISHRSFILTVLDNLSYSPSRILRDQSLLLPGRGLEDIKRGHQNFWAVKGDH